DCPFNLFIAAGLVALPHHSPHPLSQTTIETRHMVRLLLGDLPCLPLLAYSPLSVFFNLLQEGPGFLLLPQSPRPRLLSSPSLLVALGLGILASPSLPLQFGLGLLSKPLLPAKLLVLRPHERLQNGDAVLQGLLCLLVLLRLRKQFLKNFKGRLHRSVLAPVFGVLNLFSIIDSPSGRKGCHLYICIIQFRGKKCCRNDVTRKFPPGTKGSGWVVSLPRAGLHEAKRGGTDITQPGRNARTRCQTRRSPDAVQRSLRESPRGVTAV